MYNNKIMFPNNSQNTGKSKKSKKSNEPEISNISNSSIKIKNETMFITFGGPTQNYHNRVKELCTQALLIPTLFTKVKGYTDRDLKTDKDFWEKHGNFIESNPRGYGYWIWKPYLIMKSLKSLNDGDVLIYSDVGCYLNLNANSVKRLYEYIEIVKNSRYGILSFQLEHLEYKYNKRVTIREIVGLIPNPNTNQIINSGQCMATIVILCKTPYSIMLTKQWWGYAENYNLINDTIVDFEHPEFVDHRHDQSIYSLLVKRNGAVMVKDETYFYPNWRIYGADYPFWAIRNRG